MVIVQRWTKVETLLDAIIKNTLSESLMFFLEQEFNSNQSRKSAFYRKYFFCSKQIAQVSVPLVVTKNRFYMHIYTLETWLKLNYEWIFSYLRVQMLGNGDSGCLLWQSPCLLYIGMRLGHSYQPTKNSALLFQKITVSYFQHHGISKLRFLTHKPLTCKYGARFVCVMNYVEISSALAHHDSLLLFLDPNNNESITVVKWHLPVGYPTAHVNFPSKAILSWCLFEAFLKTEKCFSDVLISWTIEKSQDFHPEGRFSSEFFAFSPMAAVFMKATAPII